MSEIAWPEIERPSTDCARRATVLCTGVIRCGLTQFGQAISTRPTMASVTAMAGSVRLISTPAARPTAKANAAYPSGATPFVPNSNGVSRLMLSPVSGLANAAAS